MRICLLHRTLSALTLAAGILVSACGSSSPEVADVGAKPTASPDLASATGTTSQGCTAKACPEAHMDILSDGFSSTGGLRGFVNEPVPWDLTGDDQKHTGRTVKVLVDKIPNGATIDPPLSTTKVYSMIRIVWTPDRALKSSEDIVVYLRDYDRCMLEADADLCNNGKRSLPDYDKTIQLSWIIESRVALANQQQNAASTASDVSNQTNCQKPDAASTAIGVLTGGIPQLIPGLLNPGQNPC